MIKSLGKGLESLNKLLSKENLDIAANFLKKGEEILDSLESINEDIKNNTEHFCEILEIDFLDTKSIKELINNYGDKKYTSVALLKAEYDKTKDRRVFFMQKLNEKNEPVNKNEILCLYVNNIDLGVQELFNNKPLLIIK